MKIDLMNPNNYKFKTAETCYMKGCNNIPEWWVGDEFGICMKCYKKLEEEN
jgi:hypothetical protein